jgi:hypothetical protein
MILTAAIQMKMGNILYIYYKKKLLLFKYLIVVLLKVHQNGWLGIQ